MFTLNQTIKSIIIGFFILYPVFYLPTTAESYEYNKMMLIVAVTLILFVLTAIKIVRQRRITLPANTFTLPLFFLTGIYLISTLFQSPSFILPLITPLSTTTIIAGFLFFLLLVYNLESQTIQHLLSFLVIDGCVISLFVLLQKLGIFPNNSFTPAGTILNTVTFLSIISVYLLSKIIGSFRGEDENFASGNVILHLFAFLLISGTTVFLTIQLFTTAKPILLPLVFGWTIFVEILKNIRTLLLGVGPTNFVVAFSLTKPLTFNSTPYWNVIFTSSSSFFLTLLTETGLLTGFFYVVILLKSLRSLKSPTTIPLLFALLLQLLLPGSMVVFTTTIIFLSLATSSKNPREINLNHIAWLGYLILLPVIILAATAGYFGGRLYLAEATFKRSLDALLNNRGNEVYNLQNQAITLNPYVDRYRVAFSRTNLALADAVASKETLTDTDKGNIPTLVKQAIDQARTAVILNRTNETNWDNLGRIYSSLSGYAQGSENWAISTFQQKLILDPLNPNTYLALAGLNLNLKNFVEAENLSSRAINVKPDLANAHYFLNLSLQGQKKYKEAYIALQKASSLLPSDSADGKKLAEELVKLAKLLPKEETTKIKAGEIVPGQSQTLEFNPATPSAIQNLPEGLPTISLPQPPQ